MNRYGCTGLLLALQVLHPSSSPGATEGPFAAVAPAVAAPRGAATGDVGTDPGFGRMPLYFVENRGQVDGRVGYYLQGRTAAFFTGDGITYAFAKPSRPAPVGGSRTGGITLAALKPLSELPAPPEAQRWAVAIDLVGARRPLWPEATDLLPTIVSYFKGPKEQWKTALPTYQTVVYRDVWPGIDVDYTVKSAQMKYTFVVQPGADPRAIKLRYRGAASVEVVDGELLVQTPLGGIRDQRPLVYQETDGCREEVTARHTVRKDGADYVASFKLGPYDRSRTLVIDPVVLVYCGYIGGNGDAGGDGDVGNSIAVDTAGNAYVAGSTDSTEATFPDTVGPDLTYNGSIYDVFVAKVKADGVGLIYAGYIGGSDYEIGSAIAVDAAGNAYVAGTLSSDRFPVTVGPDLTFNGLPDAFVAKVSADGTSLGYAGYIGGGSSERAESIAVDAAGNAYVFGNTGTADAMFPTTVGPDLTFNGSSGCCPTGDAFVAKVKADGTGLVYAGYIGGLADDAGADIAVDADGNAYVTGSTYSDEGRFPIAVGPDPTFNGPAGGLDAFVTKVKADGTGLDYSGYIGGAGYLEGGRGIAVDGAGNAYVAGLTDSDQITFPDTVGPNVMFNGGFMDAFVAKVRADGSGLVYAGYIGGDDDEAASSIAVDGAGNAYVAGGTASSAPTFPVTIGPDLTYNGGQWDAFVAKVRADGTGLGYAGYIGGSDVDFCWDLAVDGAGNAYVAGATASSAPTFPVTIGPDPTYNGGKTDAFVAKVVERSCLRGNLVPPVPLLGVKTADALGARFEWATDPNASEYHLNTVTMKTDLRETDPTSPRQMPTGQGETQCKAFAPAVTCTDADAIVDLRTLLFYQMLSACGPSGADEGPVCTAPAPCP